MNYQRSPFKIQGNKFALLPHIKEAVNIVKSKSPKHDIWIEPFMGSGTVGFNMAEGPASFYDINPHPIAFFKGIKSGKINANTIRKLLREEKRKFKDDGSDRFYLLREEFNKTADPLIFFLLNRTSYNGLVRFNKSGGYNTPYCRNDMRITDSLIESLANIIESLSIKIKKWDWNFTVADFATAINQSKEEKSPLLFLDPPYIERNPTYFTGWSELDEQRLFELVSNIDLDFILTTWARNSKSTHINKFFTELWSKNYPFIENDHTYIINGVKKDIDSVKIKEAIVYYSNKGDL